MSGRPKRNSKNTQRPSCVTSTVSQKRKLVKEQEQNKRRRSDRYNLRPTNSVVFVCEAPCCQTSEQERKYTKLGLNTALFLNGSRPPKRKQSHISIITVSSDDEVTSEQWTSNWVNSLCENNKLIEEEERLRATKNQQQIDKGNNCNENQEDKDDGKMTCDENEQHGNENSQVIMGNNIHYSQETEHMSCNEDKRNVDDKQICGSENTRCNENKSEENNHISFNEDQIVENKCSCDNKWGNEEDMQTISNENNPIEEYNQSEKHDDFYAFTKPENLQMNHVQQQIFEPMSSSTPNTSSSFQPTIQYQTDKWNNPIETDPSIQNLAEHLSGNSHITLYMNHEVSSLTNGEEHTNLSQNQENTFHQNPPNWPTWSSNVQQVVNPGLNNFEVFNSQNLTSCVDSGNIPTSPDMPLNVTTNVGWPESDSEKNENQPIESQFYFGSTVENVHKPIKSFPKDKSTTYEGISILSGISSEHQESEFMVNETISRDKNDKKCNYGNYDKNDNCEL